MALTLLVALGGRHYRNAEESGLGNAL